MNRVGDRVFLTWNDVREAAAQLRSRLFSGSSPLEPEGLLVWGIPTGGSIVALLLDDNAKHTEQLKRIGMVDNLKDEDEMIDEVIVDDIIDSGETLRQYAGFRRDTLYRKPHSPPDIAPNAQVLDGYVVFPWEHEMMPESAVTRLIEYVGENPCREGLKKTPLRVINMLHEMTTGYRAGVQDILSATFPSEYDEMVVETGIEFTSLCEHHLLPFSGTCSIGYIPAKPELKVVGASKLARLVEVFSKRLQLQERMTKEIAEALDKHLKCTGIGVVVKAHHSCMGCRGVKQRQSQLITSAMLGCLREDAKARAEFLALIA